MTGWDGKYLVSLRPDNEHSRPIMAGEPCFVFRPSDKLIVPILGQYSFMCEAIGCQAEHARAILRHQRAIIEWQLAHPDLVKVPD